MRLNRLTPVCLLLLLIGACDGVGLSLATAASPRTVALAVTTTRREKPQLDLAAKILALLEAHASSYSSIALVERQQLHVVFQELVAAQGAHFDPRKAPRIGKLAAADLLLTGVVIPNQGVPGHRLLIRIVESQTGQILEVAAAPVAPNTVDDVARQTARHLAAVIESPQEARVTVAVSTFESRGRFDRLRPLEFAIQEMLTTALVNASRFRVLQRRNLKELQKEMELIQSGLVDADSIAEDTPSRGAVYLVQGEVDEMSSGPSRELLVQAKVIHARSQKEVYRFELRASPESLEEALAAQTLRLIGMLLRVEKLPDRDLKSPVPHLETRGLAEAAWRDLRRIRRVSPIDRSTREFVLPGMKQTAQAPPHSLRTPVIPDSALGRHLLRKSIDRLEAALFIRPDHPDQSAMEYALAYAYSFHMAGILNVERAETLLRRVIDRDPRSALGAEAMRLFSELSYHHSRSFVPPKLHEAAPRQLRFALENTPPRHRDYRWARLPELLQNLYVRHRDLQSMAETLQFGAEMIGQVKQPNVRKRLTLGLAEMAFVLSRQPNSKGEFANSLLKEWGESEDKYQRHAGALVLAKKAGFKSRHREAARWYEIAVASYELDGSPQDAQARNNLQIRQGRHLRLAGEVKQAKRVFESIDMSDARTTLNRGYRDVELGICLEQLGKRQQAVEIWLEAAEAVPNLAENSDLAARLKAAGGVPIRPQCDIKVTYLPLFKKQTIFGVTLATNGRQIFGIDRHRGNQVLSYDLQSKEWSLITSERSRISSLEYTDRHLWIGTELSGVWRLRLADRQWTHWGTAEGLPDLRVASLTSIDDAMYVGIGAGAGGGLVKIDGRGRLHVFDDEGAPRSSCTQVVADETHLYARTMTAIHQLDRQTNLWRKWEPSRGSPALFSGRETIWASAYQREIYPFSPNDDGDISDRFQAAWYPKGRQKAEYVVRFVEDRGDHLWFGGSPWQKVKSSGLYRINKETGKFTMYGVRDGFRLGKGYVVYDGVWADDRLWLATSDGMAVVEHRDNTN